MPRIRVYGLKVIFDEVQDAEYYISRPETWASFLANVPRRGRCRLSVGHPLANGDGRRINSKHLKEYSFKEACRRVELELAPKTG